MYRIEEWSRGIFYAWNMLIDFPLPTVLEKRLQGSTPQLLRLISFPLLGVLIGVAIALIAGACGILFNKIATGMIFALLGIIFLDFKDSGRGVSLLLSLIMLKLRKVPFDDAIEVINPDLIKSNLAQPLAMLVAIELVKLLLLFLLSYYGVELWLVVILVGGFAVQGALAMLPDQETGKSLLAISHEKQRMLGWMVAVIYVILMFRFPVGMIASGAIVYIIATGFRRHFQAEFGGITANWITLVGAITENMLLLVGILLALRVN